MTISKTSLETGVVTLTRQAVLRIASTKGEHSQWAGPLGLICNTINKQQTSLTVSVQLHESRLQIARVAFVSTCNKIYVVKRKGIPTHYQLFKTTIPISTIIFLRLEKKLEKNGLWRKIPRAQNSCHDHHCSL